MKTGIEWQVSSLELAKKLKKLGVKQESYFSWVEWGEEKALRVFHGEIRTAEPIERVASAFTVAELGKMLPDRIAGLHSEGVCWLICDKITGHSYACHYTYLARRVITEVATNEADARVAMLIYLIENKLVDPISNQE